MRSYVEKRGRVTFFGLAAAVMAGLLLTASPSAAQQYQTPKAWKFGIISDTQWTGGPDDGLNPNSVAVDAINQLNQQLIDKGAKLVVAVGDITDKGTIEALDTRAAFAQALYNAGVGFYPLRGNHEGKQAAAVEFQRVFPQTQNGMNNVTPADVYKVPNPDQATQPTPTKAGSNFTIGANFSSPSANLAGLSYAFDYNNARFVLLDQFATIDGKASDGSAYDINNNAIASQQAWITTALARKPAGGHAFIFGHKGLVTENHTDTLLGANPNSNAAAYNVFQGSLSQSGVRYYWGGHDHMENRAIVTSPDGKSQVENIIAASDSSKFYHPQSKPNDQAGRERLISQQLGTVGYQLVTVDGPRVTVEYYGTKQFTLKTPAEKEGHVPHMSCMTFARRETFGYSLNGKHFDVAQGKLYTTITDAVAAGDCCGEKGYLGTKMQILAGANGSTAACAYDKRAFTKDVNTGWAPGSGASLISDVLSLWGIADVSSNHHDLYVLSMSYQPSKLVAGQDAHLAVWNGSIWVNAVDMDSDLGAGKRFVSGAFNPAKDLQLGCHGFDSATHTAWAVIDHGAVAFGTRSAAKPIAKRRK